LLRLVGVPADDRADAPFANPREFVHDNSAHLLNFTSGHFIRAPNRAREALKKPLE